MKGQALLHTIYLYVLVFLVYVWSSIPILAQYNLQLTGALILVYFAFRQSATRQGSAKQFNFLSVMILSSITLLLVFSTGSSVSPLFFLLDFLLFALALIFEPVQAGAVAALLIAIFLWTGKGNLTPEVLINLVALALTSPLAVIFGRTFLSNMEAKGKIKILKEAIEREEVDSLLWVSKTAKPSLSTILNSISDLVIYLNSARGQITTIPSDLIDKLKAVQNDLIILYSSTEDFKKTIEKEVSDIKDI